MVRFAKNLKDEIMIKRFISHKVVSGMKVGLSLIDKNMRVVWANQVVSRWHGSLKNVCGTYCFKAYRGRENICDNCPTIETFKTGTARRRVIHTGLSKIGERYYQLTTAPVRNGGGDVIYVLEMVQDITDYARARRSQERALARKVIKRTKKLKALNKQMLSVFKIGQSIAELNLDLDSILDVIAKEVCSITNSKACSIRLIGKRHKNLIFKAGFGLSESHRSVGPIRVGEGACGHIAKTLKPLVIEEIEHSRRYRHKNIAEEEGFKSALGVPIVFRDDLLGTIMAYDRRTHRYTGREINLLALIASQTAVAIKNAQFHIDSHINYLSTVHALVLTMEAKDPYTRGHSEKVARYALTTAYKLGLGSEDIRSIRQTAKLHDIGKIAIPDSILNKPNRLTPSERAIVELHPIKGEEILSPLEFLDIGLPLVRHHHERYDGAGYPDGLKESEIPMTARILCVADAFDAMTSDRPYRRALSIKAAVKELCENSGCQFDPKVVKTFLKILKRR